MGHANLTTFQTIYRRRLSPVVTETASLTEPVNLIEAPLCGIYRVACSDGSGRLIHEPVGSFGGSGGLRTKRSGCAW